MSSALTPQGCVDRPQELSLLPRVSWVACGIAHTLAIAEGGRLFSWGHARSFLGHGDYRSQKEHVRHVTQPREVEALRGSGPVVRAAAGWAHSVCVTEGGRVFAWGCGGRGRLGLGSTVDEPVPRQLEITGDSGGEVVVEVAAGAEHSAALGSAGAVWTWGSGASCGQGAASVAEEEEGELSGDVLAPRRLGEGLPEDFRAAGLALGAHHGVVLGGEGSPEGFVGSVFTFGRGSVGQLGHGLAQDEPHPQRVRDLEDLPATSVGAGAFHTLVGMASGELVAFGSMAPGEDPTKLAGAEGRLGCDPADVEAHPAAAEGSRSGTPPQYLAKPRLVLGPWKARDGSEVVAVAGGGYHSLFSTKAGEVFSMGAGPLGRLGREWEAPVGGAPSCAEPRRVALRVPPSPST